ncbi:MAG: RHS repeat-associated core domain-containing protein [Terracidiphilus sp.]
MDLASLGDHKAAKSVNGVVTRYLVDDLSPTGYPQVVEELVNGVAARQYTYGLQRISQNQLVNGQGTPSFYEYDGGGNVRALTSAAGQVTDSYEYDAFGNEIGHSGATPNNYLYRGEQWDPDLSLYYLRARYYNPVTGRFLSQDPYAGDVYDPPSLHRYRYAQGNPTNYIDPSGRASITEYFYQAIDFTANKVLPPAALGAEIACYLYAEASAVVLVDQWLSLKTWQKDIGIISITLQFASCEATGKFTEGEGQPVACSLCFAAGTPVHTDHGNVPVEKIEVGDRVFSRNQQTGKTELRPVTALTPPHRDRLLELRIEGEPTPLRPSTSHPFWAKRRAADPGHWIVAANLVAGELLETLDGRWAAIESVIPVEKPETVYNFTVDENHDYFVGEEGVPRSVESC